MSLIVALIVAGGCGVPDFTTWSHLFRGTRKNNGSISGFHHAEAGMLPRLVSIERVTGASRAGFYKAKVYSSHSGRRVRKRANGGVSTMFPDDWSRSKVRDVANAANLKSLTSGSNLVPLDQVLGARYSGISLQIFRGSNGKVTSIFPKF